MCRPGERLITVSDLVSVRARGALLKSREFVAAAEEVDPEALANMRAEYKADLEAFELAAGYRERPDWSGMRYEDVPWDRYDFKEIGKRMGVSKQAVSAWFARNMVQED